MKIEVVGISDRGFLLGDQHDDNYCVIGVPEPANISLEDMLQIENVNSKTDLKVAKNESGEERIFVSVEAIDRPEAEAVGFFEALGNPGRIWYQRSGSPWRKVGDD